MNRRIAVYFAGVALLLVGAIQLRAQVTVYTWTGLGGYGDLYYAGNWLNDTPPANVSGTDAPGIANALANTQLVFGNSGNTYAYYYTLYANRLTISGNVMGYYLEGDYETTHLGAGGIIYNPAGGSTSTISGSIQLEAAQTWNVQGGTLHIDNAISGTHAITKTGAGTLLLSGDSPGWTGGLTLSAGATTAVAKVDFETLDPMISGALGTGTLIFGGGTLRALPDTFYATDGQELILTNNIVSNGLISVAGFVPTYFDNATVTLNADTTIKATGQVLGIGGNIAESGGARKLIIDSDRAVYLDGTSGWTGGTEVVNQGILIFDGNGNFPGPAASIKVSAEGYAGTGDHLSVAAFLAAFDKANTLGTIGFDDNTFTAAIDLTGFNASARLGSASEAVISGTITPQATSYRFGGGGGLLQVDSLLTGTNSLVLDSPASRPLTVYVTNLANNYTGGTSITQSGVIFAGDGLNGAFSGSAGSIMINQGGYAGFEPWGDQSDQQMVDGSLARLNSASVGMVGFDSEFFGGFLAANINLSGFANALYLGTATGGGIDDGFYDGFTLTGTITPAGGPSAPFRFAAHNGGFLQVESALTGTNGIHIGDPNSPATFGNLYWEEYSTVALSGNNSALSGNVTLYAGQLGISQANGVTGTDPANTLGSGSLIVQGMTLPPEWADANGGFPKPKLVVEGFDTIIPNNVVLNTDLAVGGWPDFELTGVVSGTGGLDIEDDISLTLSGNNTFSGGIYLYGNSTLLLNHNNAAGTGPLEFGAASGAEVYFNTAAPVIGGLANPDYEISDDYVYLYATQPNTVLTINQSANSIFGGEFRSEDIGDAMRVVKTGSGSLGLGYGGLYFYNGTPEATLPGTPQVSLQINQGTVVIGNDFYIEGSVPTIWVHGGTLALASGGTFYSIYNPIIVDNGGRITGNGYLATSVGIGTGATLSPGAAFAGESPIGRLDLWHLDAKAGGTLEWDIMKADPTSDLWDQIFISTPSTLDFSTINLGDTHTAANRFTLKVISRTLAGAQGLLADFNPALSYSWLLFDTDNIAGFDPGKVIIDTSLFTNSLDAGGGNGYFFVTKVGNDLLLNFAPVPEPSTYALMLSGLALAALQWRRRNRIS